MNPRSGILSLTIKDKAVLYAAYMPFIQGGGLFIPTNKQYQLGDEVFMLLKLMDEPEKIPVAGKVVWVTPKVLRATRLLVLVFSLRVKNLWLRIKWKLILPAHSSQIV